MHVCISFDVFFGGSNSGEFVTNSGFDGSSGKDQKVLLVDWQAQSWEKAPPQLLDFGPGFIDYDAYRIFKITLYNT
jgi:hypothetical protein